jgi:hypothetical protein
MDWNDASDQEIMEQLRKSELADRLLHSDEWKLVHEALKRTHDKHQLLLQEADPRDTELIMNLQLICKMYREEFLPQLVRNFKNIGEFAFEEAQRRNLLQRFLDSFK